MTEGKGTRREGRTRARRAVALALALTLSLGAAAEAKKSKSKSFSERQTVNAAIPPDAATGPSTPLISEIKVPKKFKKKVVGDVNVTGLETAGSTASAADDLVAILTAPNGRTVTLISQIGDISIGPLTLDDDTTTTICDSTIVPCQGSPGGTLYPPFAGTANLLSTVASMVDFPGGPLSDFDGIKMTGTWTLTVSDIGTAAANSVLTQWGLRIKPAKPVSE